MGKRGPKPGTPRVGGRQKGTPNKTTAQLKDAILNAFAEVGGQKYLVRIASEDPRTFCTLLGKVLPTTLAGDPDEPVRIVPVLNVTVAGNKPEPAS